MRSLVGGGMGSFAVLASAAFGRLRAATTPPPASRSCRRDVMKLLRLLGVIWLLPFDRPGQRYPCALRSCTWDFGVRSISRLSSSGRL